MLFACEQDKKEKLVVYQSPTCGCCSGWVTNMEQNGFNVESIKTNDMYSAKVKAGIDVLAGVVDCGYRDEVKVVLQNLNLPEFLFKHPNDKRGLNASALFGDKNRHDIAAGDRIAQIIIEKCYYPAWIEQETLTEQGRNGGFGSTGI